MLDDFSKTNPYGIKARAEIAGAAYPDVYNKVNAAIQAGQPPEISVAYQNQAAFYRAQGAVLNLTPFIKSSKYGLSDNDQKDTSRPSSTATPTRSSRVSAWASRPSARSR